MNKRIILSLSALLVISTSCNRNTASSGHTHDTVGSHSHEETSAGFPTVSLTLFSSHHELFVEFPHLVVGQISTFAAHFTSLEDYKPVTSGMVTVGIVRNNKGIRHSVEGPSSPGIFKPALQPKEAGIYQMFFQLETGGETVNFNIDSVQVYNDLAHVIQNVSTTSNESSITFLKEQAWKTDFGTIELTPQPFYSIIHTAARVRNHPQSEMSLPAQYEGKANLVVVRGQSVKKGDLLALITGSGIDNNPAIRYNETKISFEKSKADYGRTAPLVSEQVISEKDFLAIKTRYLQDSMRFYQMANVITESGFKMTAPFDGYISGIHIQNGSFVNSGEAILTVSNKNQLIIEAYVNQGQSTLVKGIYDAHFRSSSSDQVIRLDQLQGRIIANNTMISEDLTRIPVTFSVRETDEIIPGMFLETFLITGRKEQVLVVPLTAIIEEQGQYYVFVQVGGESFQKKEVILANNDGFRAEISDGLSAGDRIVSKGAFQVKLSDMAGDLPLHGHTH